VQAKIKEPQSDPKKLKFFLEEASARKGRQQSAGVFTTTPPVKTVTTAPLAGARGLHAIRMPATVAAAGHYSACNQLVGH